MTTSTTSATSVFESTQQMPARPAVRASWSDLTHGPIPWRASEDGRAVSERLARPGHSRPELDELQASMAIHDHLPDTATGVTVDSCPRSHRMTGKHGLSTWRQGFAGFSHTVTRWPSVFHLCVGGGGAEKAEGGGPVVRKRTIWVSFVPQARSSGMVGMIVRTWLCDERNSGRCGVVSLSLASLLLACLA